MARPSRRVRDGLFVLDSVSERAGSAADVHPRLIWSFARAGEVVGAAAGTVELVDGDVHQFTADRHSRGERVVERLSTALVLAIGKELHW